MPFLKQLDSFLNEDTLQDEEKENSQDQILVATSIQSMIHQFPRNQMTMTNPGRSNNDQISESSLFVPKSRLNQVNYTSQEPFWSQTTNQNSYLIFSPLKRIQSIKSVQSPPVNSSSYPQYPNCFTQFDNTYEQTVQVSSFNDYQNSFDNITSSNKFNINVLPSFQSSIFTFTQFNEMQSKCFPIVYNSSNNCIISAPTGSGKTVLFELAILREFGSTPLDSNFKVLYLAPTKALCSERQNDWNKKFKNINLTVGTLTGDTTFKEAEHVRKSNIIISTPEKWDMITRKWIDYKKLFGLIKLLLIDEIHILKESRGSTLEVVITRMKRLCTDLRILAISATVANAPDLASWVKLNGDSNIPAEVLCFGDEYRSVKLHKMVYGYKTNSDNDFQFDMVLNSKLNEVISENSKNKPVLIFCPTRNSCQGTAKFLFNNRLSSPGASNLKLKDQELFKYVQYGIAYHHAGLSYGDRKLIENSFINGKIKYLCCTSTLAVGINLPAYLVIIKGTKCWADGMFREYSETDILQMLGRAGRPQFENEGVSVIMTNIKLKQKYVAMVKGTEKIESSLHLNFPENLAAEIWVGAINNLDEALQWLKSTYFYVRFKANPAYYIPSLGVECKSPKYEETLTKFCRLHVNGLLSEKIITIDNNQIYSCTKYGQSMTTHYIMFETMKRLIRGKFGLTISEIFELLANCAEFNDFKLKYQERRLFKEINSSPMIRYPAKTKDLQNNDKLKLIIQFELSGIEFPKYNGAMKLHSSFLGDKLLAFKHLPRLMMAILDVMVEKSDSITLRNSSYLYRCINGKCWEDSPNELRQLDGIGPVAVKSLIERNILCLEDAKQLSSTQVENIFGWKIGAGNKVKHNLQALPCLELLLFFDNDKLEPSHTCITITFSVEIKVINPKEASTWKGKPVYIQIITDLSNGHLIDFRRIPIFKFVNSETKRFQLSVTVSNINQIIKCQACAESIASVKVSTELSVNKKLSSMTLSKFVSLSEYDFDDDFSDSEQEDESIARRNLTEDTSTPSSQVVPTRKMLDNGNFECNHICKDKSSCRHFCCKDGVSKHRSNKNDKQVAQVNSTSNSKQSRYSKNTNTEPSKPIEPKNLFIPNKPRVFREHEDFSIVTEQPTNTRIAKARKKMIQSKRNSKSISYQGNPLKRNIFDDSDTDSDLNVQSLFNPKKTKKMNNIVENPTKVKSNIFSIDESEVMVNPSDYCKIPLTVTPDKYQLKKSNEKSNKPETKSCQLPRFFSYISNDSPNLIKQTESDTLEKVISTQGDTMKTQELNKILGFDIEFL